MSTKHTPKKVTLAMMKGKSITTSVPVIHYHASDDELEEIYPITEDEKRLTPESDKASPAKSSEKKLSRLTDLMDNSSDNSDLLSRSPGGESNLLEGTPPSSDPWKVLSDITGKITKTFEEKFSDRKNDRRKKSASPKDNCSLSDCEDTENVVVVSPSDNVNENPVVTLEDKESAESAVTIVARKGNPARYVGFSLVKTGLKDKVLLRESVDSVESGIEAAEFPGNDCKAVVALAPETKGEKVLSRSDRNIRSRLIFFNTFFSQFTNQLLRQISYRSILLVVTTLCFYYFTPLPEYLLGFVMGVFATITICSTITRLKKMLTTLPEERCLSGPVVSVLEIPAVEEHSVVERFQGWINEFPYSYEPGNYHVARTNSVFLRLQGGILRILETRTKIPKRAVWDEPKHKLKFTKRRAYDLIGAKVELLPHGLTRRRRWSKKYPICVTIRKGALIRYVTLKTSSNDDECALRDDDQFGETPVKRKSTSNRRTRKWKRGIHEKNGSKYEELTKKERVCRLIKPKSGTTENEQDLTQDEETALLEVDDVDASGEDTADDEEEGEDDDDDEYSSIDDYEETIDSDIEEYTFEEDIVEEYALDEKKGEGGEEGEGQLEEVVEQGVIEEKQTEKKGDDDIDERKETKEKESTEEKKEINDAEQKEDEKEAERGSRVKPKSKLFLFARTDREKEDWYRRLSLAASPKKRAISGSSNNNFNCSSNNNPSDLSYNAYMAKYLETPSATSEDTLWVNCLIARILFDMHNCPETITLIQEKIQRKLANIKLPYFMECLFVSEVVIGQGAPVFRNVTKPVNNERGLWFDLNMTYKGCLTMTVETKLNLMKLTRTGSVPSNTSDALLAAEKLGQKPMPTRSPIFDSDVEDSPETSTEEEDACRMQLYNQSTKCKETTTAVQSSGKKFLSMVDRIAANKYFQHATELPYVRRAMEGVSNTEIRLMVTVSGIDGCVSVNIPPAPSDRLWYAFKPVPKITLTVTPAVGERTLNIVYVTKWIETKLLREFEKLVVLPNMDDLVLPFCPNYPYATSPR